MASVVTRELSLLSARAFVSSVTSSNGPYYVWIGNPVDPDVDNDVYDTPLYTVVDPYDKMIMGKEVTANDVSLMVRKIEYSANTVYDMYDDSDPALYEKDYYVSVTSGDYTHVFKCLWNNNGEPSTAAPDIGDVDENDVVYQTSDGYQWRYMYTVEDTELLKFSSPGYIPLTLNASASAPVSGAIDVIKVLSPGSGYDNHLTGTFGVTDVAVGGNSLVYSVSSNLTASSVNGYYTGCVMYISSGTGAGGYRTITDYVSNSSGKFCVVANDFSVQPLNGSVFQISPEVSITGDGLQTSNAAARAIINSTGNTIHRVEVLARGRDYSTATATVVANSVVGVSSNAILRVINGPPGGHGFDVAAELGVTRCSVSVKLEGNTNGLLPGTGRFGQYGIMTRPVFRTANVRFHPAGGTAQVGATLLKIQPTKVQESCTVGIGANTITSAAGDWTDTFSNGDLVYVTDTSERHLGTITAVNSTVVTITSAFGWSSSNVEVWSVETLANAYIKEVHSANNLCVSNVAGIFDQGAVTIVPGGGFWGEVDSVERSGVAKNQSTFIQMDKVVGSYVSGTLQENEVVFQGNNLSEATMTGWVHSIEDAGGTITVYITDRFGTIDTGASLKGNTSGASLSISDKYEAELIPGTGRILYVENSTAVTRDEDQSEELNFLISF